MKRIRHIILSRRVAVCPTCGTASKRHSTSRRTLREIGCTGPTTVEVVYSKHYCPQCRKFFSQPMEHIAQPAGRYTNRVRRTAVDLVIKHALTLDGASQRMRRKYFVDVPPTTLHDWVVEALVA